MAERAGVGLLGLGTVGTECARRLVEDWRLLHERCGGITPVLRHVAVRHPDKPRDVALPDTVQRSADPHAVVADPAVDVVVEVMGGVDDAVACMETALHHGKRVVTANKAAMALHGPRLAALAREHGAGLWHEATVCAGLPVVAMLRDSLLGDRVDRIDGVLNGTTNVILTRMRGDGVSLEVALSEAQARGFAEADPASDIDGWDATYKLVLLTWLAFSVHVPPDDVDRRGIRHVQPADLAYAGRLGYSIKLLAHAERSANQLHLRVRPTLVPSGHPLFAVDDSASAVAVHGDLAGDVRVSGLAAGGASTASAVISDLVHAVRGDALPAFPQPRQASLLSDEDVEVAGYIRMRLSDVPEARELVVQALEDRGVPVADAVLARQQAGDDAQLVALTGTAPRAVHDRALETLETLTAVRDVVSSYDRIEA